MSLRSTMRDLLITADQRGRHGPKKLNGGAFLEARSELDGETRRRQLRVSRVGVPPSAAEIVTFRRDGLIPPEAVEASYHIAKTNTYVVTITWEARQFVMPEARLPESLGGS